MTDSTLAAQARLHLVFQGVFGAVALAGLIFASIAWHDAFALLLALAACLLVVASQALWTRFFSAIEARWPVGSAMFFAQGCWYAGIVAAALSTLVLTL